jgi:DNA polymerase III epsilon subunit-like protein
MADAKFGRDEKEELLDRRASLFAGLRVIVCDNETTGLNTNSSRIVSVALYEIQQGRVLAGYASLVDPGQTRIGASHIHHITADTLRRASAPSFEVVGPRILEHLTQRGDETVILAGYNVVFDALLIHNELVRINSSMPPLMLLDAKTLAQTAAVSGGSLAELAKSLKITAHDDHSSIGDTSVTTEALLRLTDQLHLADPDFRIEPFLVPFDPAMRVSRRGFQSGKEKEEAPLTPEHAQAHELDLTHKARRERALRICLAENCVHLVGRTQDGITDPVTAWQVGEWIGEQLDRDVLTRVTRGRLITALAMAAGATDDGDYIRETYNWIEPRLALWGPCRPGDQCDRCQDDDGRTCRYLAVRYALVAAFLYRDNELSVERATAFLPHIPGDRRPHRGHPPIGWFGLLVNAGDLDTAGYGAHLVAQAGAVARTHGRERRVLAFAWGKGSRNAKLADRYSLRILADGSDDPARPHLTLAEQVCVDALALRAGSKARVFDRLESRLERIRIRIAHPPKPPPAYTRNARPPRTSSLRVT